MNECCWPAAVRHGTAFKFEKFPDPDRQRSPEAIRCHLRQQMFAKICHAHYHLGMSTMNISLPESLKSFVDAQVSSRGFGSSSEYVRELIRKDQDRLHLRELLLAGAGSKPAATADATYFASLRDGVVNRTPARQV